jgi:hypothetical protein
MDENWDDKVETERGCIEKEKTTDRKRQRVNKRERKKESK